MIPILRKVGWDLNPNDKVVNAISKDVKPIMASVHATMTPKTNDVRAARIENMMFVIAIYM